MKQKVRASSVIPAILLLLSLIFALGTEVFAQNAEAAGNYDYSHPGSEGNIVYSASDVLREHLLGLGENLSQKEKEFAERFSKFSISYNSTVMTDNVTLEYDGGRLFIYAKDYTYIGENGKEFRWSPSYAIVGNERVSLLPYSASLKRGELSCAAAPSECTVMYESEICVSSADINSLINLYYDTAEYIHRTNEYNEYVIAKRLYDDALAKYNKYLNDLAQYEADLEAIANYDAALQQYYLDYAAYTGYLERLDAYEGEYAKYSEYVNTLSVVKSQIAGLNLINKLKTEGRTIYAAVMGGTVDSVLENESLIVGVLKVDAKVVEQAGRATDMVREYMVQFNSLKTDEEKYTFYALNYVNICDAFLKLTQALDKLYESSGVQLALVNQGKKEKYLILVAQLAALCDTIIDGEIRDYDGKVAYDEKWTIDGKRMSKILTGYTHIDTDNATPLESGYPQAVKKPVSPDKVDEPVMPKKPASAPVEPTAVPAPSAEPQKVDKPSNDTLLSIHEELSEDERAFLEQGYLSGTIKERNEVSVDRIYKVQTSVAKKYNSERVDITFRSPEGNELYKLEGADSQSPLIYGGEIPSGYKTDEGNFVFAGWKNSSGEKVSLSDGVTESCDLYAYFVTYHSVTWIVDGNTLTEILPSGEIPACPFVPKKADDANAYYVFMGWDKNPAELHSDETYTAVFEKHYIVPLGPFGADISDDGSVATCDAGAYTDIDISVLLSKIAGKRSLVLKTGYGTLSFSFTDVIAMHNSGAARLKLSIFSNGGSKYSYMFDLYDKNGNLCTQAIEADASFTHVPAVSDNTVIYTHADAGIKYVKYSYDGTSLSFTLTSSEIYKTDELYEVIVMPNELASVTVSGTALFSGENVYVSVVPNDGVEILEIVVTDSSGNAVALGADGKIYGITDDIVISVKAKYKVYTIVFKANGKSIAKYEIMHGQAVEPPTPPVLGNDEYYSYAFFGWDKEVTIATGDAVYTALYSKTRLVVDTDTGGLKISASIKKLLVIGIIAIGVFFLSVSSLVVLIVVRRKKRKNAIKRRRNATLSADDEGNPEDKKISKIT